MKLSTALRVTAKQTRFLAKQSERIRKSEELYQLNEIYQHIRFLATHLGETSFEVVILTFKSLDVERIVQSLTEAGFTVFTASHKMTLGETRVTLQINSEGQQ